MSSSPYNNVTACNSCGTFGTGCNNVQSVKIAAKSVSRLAPIRAVRSCVPNASCNKIAAIRTVTASCKDQPTGMPVIPALFANVNTYSPTNLAYCKHALFGIIRPYRTEEGYYTALWGDNLVINDEGKTFITDTRESDYLKTQIQKFAEQENGNVTLGFTGFAQVGSSSEIANIIGATMLNYGIDSILYMIGDETTTEIHLLTTAFEKLRFEFPTFKVAFAFVAKAPEGIVREDILKELSIINFVPDLFVVASDVSFEMRDHFKQLLEGREDFDVANPLGRGAINQLVDYYRFDCITARRMLGVWCNFNNTSPNDFTQLFNYVTAQGYKTLIAGDIVTDSRTAPPNLKLELFRSLTDVPFTQRIVG